MRLFWPVGRQANASTMPPQWFAAVLWAQWYQIREPRQGETLVDVTHCHTGIDFNLPNYADSGEPVCAMADGIVRFADDGARIGWTNALQVVVIHHPQLDIWTRSAHLVGVALSVGQSISAGQAFGRIGDYGRPGKYDDHCHFDMARLNLGAKPGDWPGKAAKGTPEARAIVEARVRRDYLDPLTIYRMVNA